MCVICGQSKRLERATGELAFQIGIALIAGNQLAQDLAYPAMAARKLNHSIGERGAPEVSIKAPALFIIERRARKIGVREKFRRAQRIVNAFAGYRVGETGSIAK